MKDLCVKHLIYLVETYLVTCTVTCNLNESVKWRSIALICYMV